MLINKTAFNEDIDNKNQQKTLENNNKSNGPELRRYQKYDKKRKVPKRQNKKRKAENMHHNDNITKCGVIKSGLP